MAGDVITVSIKYITTHCLIVVILQMEQATILNIPLKCINVSISS